MGRYEILRNSKKGLNAVEKREIRKGQLEDKQTLTEEEKEELDQIYYDIEHKIIRGAHSEVPLWPIGGYKYCQHIVV